MLEAQRAAFFAELPVSLATRCDRLRRAIAMIDQNSAPLCSALDGDTDERGGAPAIQAQVAPALAVLGDSLRDVARWMRPVGGRDFLTRLLRGDSYTEYQPAGVVGLAPPPILPLLRTASMLAGALAAGNRVVIGFDSMSDRFGALLAELAPRYFDPLELAVIRDEPGLTGMGFDLLARGGMGEAETDRRLTGSASLARSAKSPAIVGRSADFAKAAERVIACKLAKQGRATLAPDYLLVPEEQEEAVAGWLWRAAMQFAHSGASNVAVASYTERAQLTRLLDDARARGGEVLVAGMPGDTGAQVPFHIIRHATEKMLVMQEETGGPILPLRSYRHVENAIEAIHRQGFPPAIHYFGRDPAERRHVLGRTISSAIAINGGALALVDQDVPAPGAGPVLGGSRGEAGFRQFSRVRQVYRQRALGNARRKAGEVAGDLGVAAPALR